jgi:hypothetical protein
MRRINPKSKVKAENKPPVQKMAEQHNVIGGVQAAYAQRDAAARRKLAALAQLRRRQPVELAVRSERCITQQHINHQ